MTSQTWDVPYVALGDSLTHSMQSLGVAEISQRSSYPALIAEYLGAEPFTQPLVRGNSDTVPGTDGKIWVGSPPNLELVLRATAALNPTLDTQNPGTPLAQAHPGVVAALKHELSTVDGFLKQTIQTCLSAVQEADPETLRVDGPAASGYYQNLGIYGFLIDDILAKRAPASFPQTAGAGPELSRLGRHALEWVSQRWDRLRRAHPSLPLTLSLAFLTWTEGIFTERLDAEKLTYVLKPLRGVSGELTCPTALEAMAAQRPHLVTLLIGPNHILPAMTAAHLYDGRVSLYTQPGDFETQLVNLVTQILNVESHPYVFIATLPSPTATPNLVRSRLGHWKSMAPSSAYLVDDQILEVENVVAGYNGAIQRLAERTDAPFRDPDGTRHVWLVDLFALYARMQRATRLDAEAARRAVAHAVRTKLVPPEVGAAALRAVRSGNLNAIGYLREVDSNLLQRAFHTVSHPDPHPLGAGARLLAEPSFTRMLDPDMDEPDVDAFIVRLKPIKPKQLQASAHDVYLMYRLTGEFLAADPDTGVIAQGGTAGLDSLHVTNTAYAYVAREYLKAIYAANTIDNRILAAFPKAPNSASAFDTRLLKVAEADTLLNDVPPFIPAVMDFLSAIGNVLGDEAYSDPNLTRDEGDGSL